jgi:Holliday junction resolvasome RuvABC endonuclease subunit
MCVLDTDPIEFIKVKHHKISSGSDIKELLLSYTNEYVPDYVYIEDIPYGVSGNKVFDLSKNIGRISQILEDEEILWYAIQNSYWKKIVIGIGKATDAQFRSLLKKRYPDFSVKTPHALDAVGIAMAGDFIHRETK